MPRVQQHQLQILDVAFVRLRAGLDEDLVVLAPDGQDRDLAVAEILLESRVQSHVGGVVLEQADLDLGLALALQQRVVEIIGLRGNVREEGFVRHAVFVLEFGGGEGEQGFDERDAVHGRVGFPQRADRVPERAESFLVGVAVLRYDGRDGLGALEGDAECYGGSIVEDVRGETLDLQGVEELERGFRQVGKGIAVIQRVWNGREAKPGKVWGNHMVGFCELRNEIAVLERGAWEAMEKKNCRVRRRSCRTVENRHSGKEGKSCGFDQST